MRIFYLIAIVLTIILGLASRKYGYLLPSFIEHHAGDALWAMMVYFGFRFILIRKRMLIAIWFSFLFCFGIEFSQLVQEDWINQIRGTVLGALIFGYVNPCYGQGYIMQEFNPYHHYPNYYRR